MDKSGYNVPEYGRGGGRDETPGEYHHGVPLVFAGLLVLSEPMSALFWVWYVCGGLSDLIDGPVARKLHQQSALGAKLDSIADIVFIACVCFAVLRSVVFPVWVIAGAIGIALVRFVSYGVGYRKYRTFATIHTWLNKATGFLLFIFPVLFALIGVGRGVRRYLRRWVSRRRGRNS